VSSSLEWRGVSCAKMARMQTSMNQANSGYEVLTSRVDIGGMTKRIDTHSGMGGSAREIFSESIRVGASGSATG